MCKRQARKLAVICMAVCAGSLFINLIYTKNFKSSIQTKSFFASPGLFSFKQELAPSYHNVSLTRATQPPMPRHPEHPNRSLFKTLEIPPVPITLDERDREVIVLSNDELPPQGSTQGEEPSQGSTQGEAPSQGSTHGEAPSQGSTQGEAPSQRSTQGEAEKSKTGASDDAPRSHTKQRGLSSERKRNETPERKNEEAREDDDADDDPKEEMEPEPKTPVTDSKDRLSSAGEDHHSPPERKGRNETSPANDAKKKVAKPGTGASKGKHKEDEEEDEYEEYDADSPNDFRDTVFDNEIMKFAALENEDSTPAANATVYCPDKSPYLSKLQFG
ncbi:hypothetical protein Btru_023227 [Bulinus truncatus]|nr:hypothetical protein Btru_023227 [Bulinus truncatus]